MGATASIELQKPLDASDIEETGSLEYAKNEVIRLRTSLGYLAKEYGMEVVVYDASDIVLGIDDREDFIMCIKEIRHIRKCLKLCTQGSKRRARNIDEKKYNDDNDDPQFLDESSEGEGSQSSQVCREETKYK
jgi:hypothetical protein